MEIVLFWIAPLVAGFGMNWLAGKSRGRNARSAFKSSAWGFWLLLLAQLARFGPIPPFPVIGPLLNLIILLTPSAICFLLAAASMVKEMRAQKAGDFTDAA